MDHPSQARPTLRHCHDHQVHSASHLCFRPVATQLCPSWALTQLLSPPPPLEGPLANSTRLSLFCPSLLSRKTSYPLKTSPSGGFYSQTSPHLSQAGELEFGSSLSLPDYSPPSFKKILPISGLFHCVLLTYPSLLVEETAKYAPISDSPL